MAQAAPFNAAYGFGKSGVEVLIQHKLEKFVRVDPDNNAMPNSQGGRGKWARFTVEHVEGGGKVRIKSNQTGKYLRIQGKANVGDEDKIDCQGGTGRFTIFNVHKQGEPGVVKLESAAQEGKYFAVQKDGVIRVGGGGPWTVMKFFKQGGGGGAGGAGGAKFGKPYMFAKTNTVVIQHKGGGDYTKFLRAKPGDLDNIDPDGGKGAFAQWEADPQDGGAKVRFKSTKTGKYLRVIKDGAEVDVQGGGGKFTIFKVDKQGDGTVRLESNVFAGKYLAVGKNNIVRTGPGGPACRLKIFRE